MPREVSNPRLKSRNNPSDNREGSFKREKLFLKLINCIFGAEVLKIIVSISPSAQDSRSNIIS